MLDKAPSRCYNKDSSGGSQGSGKGAEAHESEVRPDNTTEWLVKVSATIAEGMG